MPTVLQKFLCWRDGHNTHITINWLVWYGWDSGKHGKPYTVYAKGNDWICTNCGHISPGFRWVSAVKDNFEDESAHRKSLELEIENYNKRILNLGYVESFGVKWPIYKGKGYEPKVFHNDMPKYIEL